MSLTPRFLISSGREEVQQAKAEADVLIQKQQKGLLRGHEQQKLDSHMSLIRRNFREKLGAVFLGFAVTVAGGIALMSRSGEKAQENGPKVVDVKEAKTPELSEAELDQLIEKVEQGFLDWEPVIRDHIQKAGGLPPGVVAEHFYAPFEVVRLNVGNPIKNHQTLQRVHHQSKEVRISDVNFFSYDTLGQLHSPVDRSNMAANFAPGSRVMSLNKEIDPQSAMDMLVVYHEVMHAVQDANIRARIQSPDQFAAYAASLEVRPGQKMRINIITEIDAYASEMEIADVLMKGTLRNGSATIDDLMRVLRPRPQDHHMVQMIHELASVYFPHGISNGQYHPMFVDLITRMYKEGGYEVYLSQ